MPRLHSQQSKQTQATLTARSRQYGRLITGPFSGKGCALAGIGGGLGWSAHNVHVGVYQVWRAVPGAGRPSIEDMCPGQSIAF
jgi:hypothetical protein